MFAANGETVGGVGTVNPWSFSRGMWPVWSVLSVNFGARNPDPALLFLAIAGYDSSQRLGSEFLASELDLTN
jgi:hypothetical protein